MKTIKIIDLLNMISKGEEVPKKIKYKNCIFENRCVIDYWCKKAKTCLDELILMQNLNDEVEIIEEEKKIPEKICTNRIINTKDILEFEMIQNKINAEYTYAINEIIDYLEANNGIMD